MGRATPSDVSRGLADPDAHVRRRACEVAGGLAATPAGPVVVVDALARALDDDDGAVVEAAAWGLGEHGGAAAHPGVLDALARVATSHQDPLCREAAVAALGAVGDRRGLAAILAAAGDRPAVRRRAVLALAPFEGPEVDQALERARLDRDWQVRQAAEDLLDG
jgi:HEAT repeat protein